MSNFTRSLALEEISEHAEVEMEIDLLNQTRHLSISDATTDSQRLYQVVKVSGSITVSF